MRRLTIPAAVLAGGVLAATALANDPARVTFPGDGTIAPYTPSAVSVQPGGSVTFNGAFAEHPLEWEGGTFPTKNAGTTETYTFANAGTFRFNCDFHSSMRGTVTVGGGTAGTTPGATPPPTSGTSDTTPPVVRLTVPGRLVRSIVVRSSEPAEAAARLRAGKVLLARGTSSLPAAGARKLVLRPTAAGRARLRRSGSVRATLTVVVTDGARNAAAVRRTVVLRRPR